MPFSACFALCAVRVIRVSHGIGIHIAGPVNDVDHVEMAARAGFIGIAQENDIAPEGTACGIRGEVPAGHGP